MNKKLLMLIVLLVIPATIAMQTLGIFEQNKNISLIQICDNCTYVNLTTVKIPNTTILEINRNMSLIGYTTYNYTFFVTGDLGDYFYTTCGDPNGLFTCQSVDFTVTATGDKVSLSNIIMVISFLTLAGIFLYIGSTFNTEKWMIKSAFFLFALLMGLLATNSARIITSESSNLNLMGTSGFILMIAVILFMFMYIFISFLVDTFKQLKNRKEIRWQY